MHKRLTRLLSIACAAVLCGCQSLSPPAPACPPPPEIQALPIQPREPNLSRQAAIDLDAIAFEGDRAIIDLNRCLAAYQATRAAVSDYATALRLTAEP